LVVTKKINLNMKRNFFLSALIISGLLPGLSSFAQSIDIPGWRGANRDGKVAGFQAPASWPTQLTKVWETAVGLGDASPVLVKGKFYLLVRNNGAEELHCVDAKTGKELWKTSINQAPEITGGASSHPGPRSTPYVSDGKVYTLGAGGVVACHDASSGKLIWKNDSYTSEVPQFFTGASPLVTEKLCIVPLGGKEHGVVAAFDTETGKEIWKLEGVPCTYASPVVMTMDKKIIINQSESNILSISLDGKLLGKFPTPGQRMFYNSSTPVIAGENVVIAGQGNGTRMLNVVKQDDHYLFSEAWANPKLGVSFNTPVLKDGFLYANDSRFGYLYCLNAKTGEAAWTDSVKLNRFASILDLGQVMLSLCGNATLVFFKPDPTAFRLLSRYKVSDTEIYAHPLVADNKIYIKDKEKLTCWEVR
jgi:outer membrane protein assembly factor BamB